MIPGERFGALTLGSTRQEVTGVFGPSDQSNYQGGGGWPFTWSEPNTGRIDRYYRLGGALGFCASNQRLFAAMGVTVGDWYPDWSLLNFWVFRMTTPEGFTARNPDRFRTVYGKPVLTIPRIGNPGRPADVYQNKLIAACCVNDVIWLIGTVDPEICHENRKSTGTVYLPWIGRGEIIRTATGKAGNVQDGTIAEETTSFKSSDPVYFLVELTFPPIPSDRSIDIIRRFRRPEGEDLVASHKVTFRAGETRKSVVFRIGPRPYVKGERVVDIHIGKIMDKPVATIKFTSTD